MNENKNSRIYRLYTERMVNPRFGLKGKRVSRKLDTHPASQTNRCQGCFTSTCGMHEGASLGYARSTYALFAGHFDHGRSACDLAARPRTRTSVTPSVIG